MPEKVRHYRQACERDGWLFQPFTVDVFGAIHPTARKIAEAIIQRFEEKHTECKTYPFATFVWRALTSASVMRAATQTMASAMKPWALQYCFNFWSRRTVSVEC